jgi:hypothetical protein
MRSIAALLLALAVLAYVGIRAIYSYDTCPDDPSIQDSRENIESEKRDLILTMKQIYAEKPSPYNPYRLPRPIEVMSIHNHGAVVRVASEWTPGDGSYEAAWRTIFREHHPNFPKTCARITYIWPTGSASSQCCNVAL